MTFKGLPSPPRNRGAFSNVGGPVTLTTAEATRVRQEMIDALKAELARARTDLEAEKHKNVFGQVGLSKDDFNDIHEVFATWHCTVNANVRDLLSTNDIDALSRHVARLLVNDREKRMLTALGEDEESI